MTADYIETVASGTWHTAYPDRRPWPDLEEATRVEWRRVIRITLETASIITPVIY